MKNTAMTTAAAGITRTLRWKILDCANCAAKLERQINALPDVTSAVLTFATKQLRVTSENPDGLLLRLQTVCSSVERTQKLSQRIHSAKPRMFLRSGNPCPAFGIFLTMPGTFLTLAFGAILFAAGIVLEHLGISITSTLVFLGDLSGPGRSYF